MNRNRISCAALFAAAAIFALAMSAVAQDAGYDQINKPTKEELKGIIASANAVLAKGQYKDAIKEFEKVLEVDPDNHDALVGIAPGHGPQRQGGEPGGDIRGGWWTRRRN